MPSKMGIRGPAKKAAALGIVVVFCVLPLLPVASAASVLVTTIRPFDGEKVSRIITIHAAVNSQPTTMGLYIDGIFYSDLTFSTYDGNYWHYTYPLNTWGLKDGAHICTIKAFVGGIGYSNGTTFFVDNFAPTITGLAVKYPEGQKAAKKGDHLVIVANVTDTVSGIDKVYADLNKLQTSDDGLMYDDGNHNDTIENDGTYGTNSFVTNALTNGYNVIHVTATDRIGNKRTTSVLVAMDNHLPDILDSTVIYPTGQLAYKLGDQGRIVTTVQDQGGGGTLRIGSDIVLVLDNSGSMMHGSDPPLARLKEAVYNLVNMTHSEDRVAIFSFAENDAPQGQHQLSESAKMYLPFTSMDQNGKDQVTTLLDNSNTDFNTAHNTPIWDTIGEAIRYAISDSQNQPVVVAMTDGTDYGYDWYERPDNTWWQSGFSSGYSGIGFERGSESYCPWNDWATTVHYTTHWGEYPAPWANDPEVHYLDAPIDDTVGFDYYANGNPEQWDYSDGNRAGLLTAPIPVFTIGLGLPHHSPVISNTTEYDLYRIATTSNNTVVKGKYYYAPDAGELEGIYNEISFFINLAGDINVTPPGGVKAMTMDGTSLGVEVKKPLYDDGAHDDIFKDDEVLGTNLFDIKTRVTDWVNVTLDATDVASHKSQKLVGVLVDNTPPVIEGLVGHVVDAGTLQPETRAYAKDGDSIYFTANASDWGRVAGLTKGLLDATVLGGDPGLPMKDDGKAMDTFGRDGVFTSPVFTVKSGGTNGFVNVTATAYDIALNTAKVSGPVWLLNGPDVLGQIVQPLNGSYVKGVIDVRLVVSDDTNLLGADLIIGPATTGGPAQRIMMLMGHAEEVNVYTVKWNTSAFPEGLTELYSIMGHKGGFKIQTPSIVVIVDNTPPVVDIQVPKEGAILTNKTDLLALVYDPPRTYVGGMNLSYVDYILDNGEPTLMSLVGGLDQNGPHYVLKVDPAAMQDGLHTVVVKAMDKAGLTGMDNVTFFTDTMPPKVTPSNIPSTSENTTGNFMFAFQAEDATGIVSGQLTLDGKGVNGTSYPFYRNSTTGLWEFPMDTTLIKNGNHTYCAVFKDRAGNDAQYCSKFIVGNVIPPNKPKVHHELEIPWWLIVVLIIVVSCLVFTSSILLREWYLKRTGRVEDEEEMVDKATKRARRDAAQEEVPIMPGPRMEDLDEGPEIPAEPPAVLPPPLKSTSKERPRTRRPRVLDDGMVVSKGAPVAVSGPVKDVLDEEPKKASKKVIKCPMCMFRIPVESDERPLVLECPKCGTKGKLK